MNKNQPKTLRAARFSTNSESRERFGSSGVGFLELMLNHWWPIVAEYDHAYTLSVGQPSVRERFTFSKEDTHEVEFKNIQDLMEEFRGVMSSSEYQNIMSKRNPLASIMDELG